MRRAATVIAAALFAATGIAWSADLEPARDALRRHEYDRAVGLLRPSADAGDAEAAFLLSQFSVTVAARRRTSRAPASCSNRPRPPALRRAAGSLAAMLESGECQTSARTASEWRERRTGSGLRSACGRRPNSPLKSLRHSRTAAARRARRRPAAGPAPASAARARRHGRIWPHAADAGDRGGQDAVARELVERGASLAAADRNGETPC